jgi:hypothetical protein
MNFSNSSEQSSGCAKGRGLLIESYNSNGYA